MDPQTQDRLVRWQALAKQLSEIKTEEMRLRKLIYADMFEDPKEGTNKVPLANDYVLKGVHKLYRKVLEDKIPDVKKMSPALAKKFKHLIKFKPEVVTSEYKKLSDEERRIFDQCLEIKPGTPSIDIVLPKRK